LYFFKQNQFLKSIFEKELHCQPFSTHYILYIIHYVIVFL